MLLINSIRNIIAIVFMSIGKLFAVPNKPVVERRKPQKQTPAINFPPTSDFKKFMELLSKKDIKGGPAVNNVFAMADNSSEALCYDMRIFTEHSGGYCSRTEYKVLARKSEGWKVVATAENVEGTCPGVIDDIILAAAARGWNCTEPAGAIILQFVEVVLNTQERNRKHDPMDAKDIMHVQFFMPHDGQPSKLVIRVYDPTSMVAEKNAPHITIPFFKATRKSEKSAA